MKNFPTCHCHVQSLDSASTPEAFAERELELGTGYITVTDHGTLAAARKVYDLAKSKKLKPIIGLEAYFRDDDCPILKKHGVEKQLVDRFGKPLKKTTDDEGNPIEPSHTAYWKYGHITIHFPTQQAFECGVKVLSRADLNRAESHGSERKPLFDWNDLEELASAGVIITSGCLIGMVQRHLLDHGRVDIAKDYYERLRGMVGPDRFFVEIFPHRCDKNWVSGVFLTFDDGTKLKYHSKKKLRTNVGDIDATELAAAFGRKDNEHVNLLGIKNYHKWDDFEKPAVNLINVEKISDFIQNECQPWCPDGDVQLGCNRSVRAIAKQYGDKLIISDDSHYAHKDEKIVQDIRMSTMGENFRFYGDYHRQSSDEAFQYFKTYMGVSEKEFEGWVDNSHEWASKATGIEFKDRVSLPKKFYPDDSLKHTMSLIAKHGRMDWQNPEMVARLKAEIELLHKNGSIDLLPYFFIDEEVCSEAERRGELTGPGRGSAAGLLLADLLGITHLNPLKYGLSMDRFMTKERIISGKLPDIDQDLPNREWLTNPEDGWLKQRFGDHYAQISVDTTLKLKSSILDVNRALHGKVLPEIHAITKKLPHTPQGISDRDFVLGYDNNGEWVPGLVDTDSYLKQYIQMFPSEWAIVQKCLGLSRQKGRHACAYVITNEPVDNFIPLTKVSDVPVTQYTAGSVEAVGGLKMDFLGLNTLVDLGEALKLVRERSGVTFQEQKIKGRRVPVLRQLPIMEGGDFKVYDIWDLPEDQAVFRDFCESSTETVFQFNTPGARQWLRHFDHFKEGSTERKALDSIEALSAFTALDRPGPLDAAVTDPVTGEQHNMLVEFANRARGEAGVGRIPALDKALPETYGVMVYQEQLEKMFREMTGCSAAEAEEFRRNVAKKKMEKVLKTKPKFMEQASALYGQDQAEAVWDQMVTFGQYGFNKSHSTAYVIISYACAFLKRHYPLEWWTAVLRNADKDEIDTKFWRHCGHLINQPDIVKSTDKFDIVDGRIQAPLSLLHGIGDGAHDQICKYRPYTSIEDFCQKMQKHRELTATKVTKKKKVKIKGKVKSPRTGRMISAVIGEEEIEVEAVKLGHSAVNRRVVYTLIVAGAMDGLFPPNTFIHEQLAMYEEALSNATGNKLEPVNSSYLNLNEMARFQLKKKILPAYSESVLKMFCDQRGFGNSKVDNIIGGIGERKFYLTYRGKKEMRWLFVSPEEIEQANTIDPLPQSMNCAVGAYIVADRRFTYQGTKQAAELVLDVDGVRLQFVKWPPRGEDDLPESFSDNLTGSLAIVLITKYAVGKPFNVDDVIVVQEPIKDTKEVTPGEDKE